VKVCAPPAVSPAAEPVAAPLEDPARDPDSGAVVSGVCDCDPLCEDGV
jgi:hypothetical protein